MPRNLKIAVGVMMGGFACLCGMALAGGFGICGPTPLGLFLAVVGLPAFALGFLKVIFELAWMAIEKHRSLRS